MGLFVCGEGGEGTLSSAAKETLHPTHYPALHMLGPGSSVLKAGVLGPRCWVMDIGHWVPGVGFWVSGLVSWVWVGLGWVM